jgi:hypothetical protein
MKLCPFCQQDAIWLVRLKSSPEQSFALCFECDSVWHGEQPISDQVGTTFDQYMRSLGKVADWKDAEKIEMVE